MLPFSSLTAFKDAALLDTNGNGGLDPGEGILYTIRIRNVGIIPITDINVIDMLNKSRGDLAYNLIDIGVHCSDEVLDKMRALDGVINVRMIGDCD